MSDFRLERVLATQYWLQNIVIGENFCPFAKREFERQRIRFVVIEVKSISELLETLSKEYKLLDKDPKSDEVETTLMILTSSFDSQTNSASDNLKAEIFDDFLLIYEEANWQLEKLGYAGVYQLASFHPDYLFAGEPQDSPSHYTNRSPFPMLHIIRETSIDRALKTFKHPESIPETNINRANQLGVGYFKKQLAQSLGLLTNV